MFFTQNIEQADRLPLRLLATLGDAVCSLIERERAISSTHLAKQMHELSKKRVNALAQAADLDKLMEFLKEKELNLVRRALNLKANNYRKTGQMTSRKSTAYEVLLGYLYLTDSNRLQELIVNNDSKKQ
jgi:ribonuclease III family protein